MVKSKEQKELERILKMANEMMRKRSDAIESINRGKAFYGNCVDEYHYLVRIH